MVTHIFIKPINSHEHDEERPKSIMSTNTRDINGKNHSVRYSLRAYILADAPPLTLYPTFFKCIPPQLFRSYF